jgi:hypothetical protein
MAGAPGEPESQPFPRPNRWERVKFSLFLMLWILLSAGAAWADPAQSARSMLIAMGIDSTTPIFQNFQGHLIQDRHYIDLLQEKKFTEARQLAEGLFVDSITQSMRAGSASPDSLLALYEYLLRRESKNPQTAVKKKWWKPSTWKNKEPISDLRLEVRSKIREQVLTNPSGYAHLESEELEALYPQQLLRNDLKKLPSAERMGFFTHIFDGKTIQPMFADEYGLHLDRILKYPTQYSEDLIAGIRGHREWPRALLTKYSTIVQGLYAMPIKHSGKTILQLEPVLAQLPLTIVDQLKTGVWKTPDMPRQRFLKSQASVPEIINDAALRDNTLWYLDDLMHDSSRLFADLHDPRLFETVSSPHFQELFRTTKERKRFAQAVLELIPRFRKEDLKSHREFGRLLTDLFPQAFDLKTEAKAAKETGQHLIAYLNTKSPARKASPAYFEELRFEVQRQRVGKLGGKNGHFTLGKSGEEFKPAQYRDLPEPINDRKGKLPVGPVQGCDVQQILRTYIYN